MRNIQFQSEQHLIINISHGAYFNFRYQSRGMCRSRVNVLIAGIHLRVVARRSSPWSNGIAGGGRITIGNMMWMKVAHKRLLLLIPVEDMGE
jgi:hypothetical protein